MRANIIKSLESARGYIDGFIADISAKDPKWNESEVDVLDFITAGRRLQVKSQEVLQSAVEHAVSTGVSWEDIAARCGLSVEEVATSYPEAAETRRHQEEARRAFDDDEPVF